MSDLQEYEVRGCFRPAMGTAMGASFKYAIAARFFLMLGTASASAQARGPAAQEPGFTWPWEADGVAYSNMLRRAAAAGPRADSPFGAKPAAQKQSAARAPAARAGAMGADAYERLVRENLDLRAELDRVSAAYAKTKQNGAEMGRRVASLQKKRETLAQLLAEMRRSGATDSKERRRLQTLEQQISEFRTQNAALRVELGQLKTRLASLTDERADIAATNTDLFRRLEKEKIELKEQVARLRADHAAELKARAESARAELERVRTNLDESTKARETLAEREQELSTALERLKGALGATEQALALKDTEIRELRGVLDANEKNLAARSRQLRTLEAERDGLRSTFRREQRDMHYNLGVLHSQHRNYEAAEQAYRKALELDAQDADSHFNLGVIYDDFLEKKEKAVHHYREFLRIKPDSPDAKRVRGWIQNIETRSAVGRDGAQ